MIMIYEYRCNTCNLVSSVERSVYDDENIPLCCGDLASRVYAPPAVTFKGNGFYSTDKR